MKKTLISRTLLLAAVSLSVVGCGNLSKVSPEGTTANPVFPKLSSAKFNTSGTQIGSWPNWENVRQIERGMNKDQLYYLIGHPHFSEGLYGVREWDYVFNYRENGEHKVCQFKVLFDKNMNAQSFYWYPNGCNGNSSFSLSGDFLFDFDKDLLTVKGKEVVDSIAKQLKDSSAEIVKVSGYTDRLGSDSYNLNLSQRRADMVKARLIEKGVSIQIEAVGYGKANQVKACENVFGKELTNCLRPNRRVEILATGGVQQQEASDVAGPNGPSLLYKK